MITTLLCRFNLHSSEPGFPESSIVKVLARYFETRVMKLCTVFYPITAQTFVAMYTLGIQNEIHV